MPDAKKRGIKPLPEPRLPFVKVWVRSGSDLIHLELSIAAIKFREYVKTQIQITGEKGLRSGKQGFNWRESIRRPEIEKKIRRFQMIAIKHIWFLCWQAETFPGMLSKEYEQNARKLCKRYKSAIETYILKKRMEEVKYEEKAQLAIELVQKRRKMWERKQTKESYEKMLPLFSFEHYHLRV